VDCEEFDKVTISIYLPDVLVDARLNQYGIQLDPDCSPTYASFQHVRNPKRITDLARIASATVWHHARAADHLKISNLRQLGQNVVLHTIGKKRVVFVFTQFLKWQHGDSSCYRTADQFALPNHHAHRRCQGDYRRHQPGNRCYAPQPFPYTEYVTSVLD